MEFVREPTYEISFRFRKILVPVDGSESSLKALDLAMDVARRYGSRVTVLHVRVKGVGPEGVMERAKARAGSKGLPISFKEVEIDPVFSSVPKAIVDEVINGGYDMVIMGARGMTVSEELNIGSVAAAVVMNAPTTIVIVR